MFEKSNPEPPPGLNEIRSIRGGRPVWVDLGAAFPFGRPLGVYPYGLDLQSVVRGDLKMWFRTTTGHWVGWSILTVGSGAGGTRISQFVMGHAMEPRREGTTGMSRAVAPPSD